MMKIIEADGQREFDAIRALGDRDEAAGADVETAVREIIAAVRTQGDAAVREYTLCFDSFLPDRWKLGKAEMEAAYRSVSADFRAAIASAAENIRTYHERQVQQGYEKTGQNGIVLGQVIRGLEKVGLYVPGGTASYPSTVLMNAIPAKLAGVETLTMVTPPRRPVGLAADFEERSADSVGCDASSTMCPPGNNIAGTGKDEISAHDLPIGDMTSGERSGDHGMAGIVAGEAPQPEFPTDPHILAAAYVAGVDQIILSGGAQAVAALAYGTETFPKVDKIVGPGNIYVATAKRLLYGLVDIDMIAGPSEILIIADGTDEDASPAFIAADLLSQAEHDKKSAAILLTTNAALADQVNAEVQSQLAQLERRAIAEAALTEGGLIILCRSESEMIALSNLVAPEHLEILTADPMRLLPCIKNAGSVFLGAWTPEPLGDYWSGTNHVLPTSGTARWASPLGVYDFIKRMSYTRYTREALKDAKDGIMEIGRREGLGAHVNAIDIRFK